MLGSSFSSSELPAGQWDGWDGFAPTFHSYDLEFPFVGSGLGK